MMAQSSLKDVLDYLCFKVKDVEEKASLTEEFADISYNDMCILEAVGSGEGDNMSSIARKLKITVGSLTTAMNHLVKKGYTVRTRGEEDRRIVYITLTEKGKKALSHKQEVYQEMIEGAIGSLNEEQKAVLTDGLHCLVQYFQEYEKKVV